MRSNQSKTLLAMIFCLMFVGGVFALPKTVQAAITYDTGTNKITVTGYTEAVPCNFNDLWTADKAGILQLWTGTPTMNITLTTQIKPSDETGLKIDFILSGTDAGAGDTIDITGTDKDGNAQNETLTTEADGTYTTTKWFKTITDVDCNGFIAGTLTIQQGQWGVVWKQGVRNFRFDTTEIHIGDGSIVSYFADTLKTVSFTTTELVEGGEHALISVRNSATFRLGTKVSGLVTKDGCNIILEGTTGGYRGVILQKGNTGKYLLYSSSFMGTQSRYLGSNTNPSGCEIYNCKITSLRGIYGASEVKNVIMTNPLYGLGTVGDIDNIFIYGGTYSIHLRAWTAKTFKNIKAEGNKITAAWMSGYNYYIINSDIVWDFVWQTDSSIVYRQYEFDLKVIDKDNTPIQTATVKIWDKDNNLIVDTTTDANGDIATQTISRGYYNAANGNTLQEASPHTIRISHQDYSSREFKFTLDKKINWTLALKDKPMSVGSIKVWGTEYADNEAGTIYAQVTYGDGSPCNTIAPADITATVYKSDGSVIINGAQMSYVASTNGIYKHDFTGGTFSAEGVYIIDVKVDSGPAPEPVITAYDSNEIHISQTANKVKSMATDIWNTATSTMTTAGSIGKLLVDNIDAKISGVAGAVWGYSGRSLDTITNIVSGVWGESQSGYTTSGTFGYYLNSRISAVASDVWNYTSSIGPTLIQNLGDIVWNSYSGVRKLTSRQIGGSAVYIPGVTESGTVAQVANETDQATMKYDVDLVRKATFDFAGIVDSGSTTTLVDSELTHPDDHWNNYELWMMSGNNIGLKVAICDFDKASHTITICGDALVQPIATGDQYVISHERKLVHAIWNWSERTLIKAGDVSGGIAEAVWGWTSGSGRKLTSRYTDEVTPVDLAQVADVSSLATSAELAQARTDLITEINENQTLITALNNITAQEVWEYGTRDLTGSVSLSDPTQIWDVAASALTETGSIGKQVADNLDAQVSTRSTLTAGDVWSESTRTLTDYATSSIALAVWNNAQRTLTSYGNDITAADVWNVLSSTLTTENSVGKQVADNVDVAVSSRASQVSVDALQTDITYIRSKVDSIHTDTQYISGKVDEILTKWGAYSTSDIMGDLDTVKSRIGTSTDIAADETLFGRTKYIQEKWGTQTGQTIFDKADDAYDKIVEVQTELGYNGTSTTAYADMQLVKGYTDELEGYVGTPADLATANTLFGKIKDVREKLDQLDVLESKLDTVDGIIDSIRASQQLNYTVELSDVGEVGTTKTYRAKLSVWDYENNPVNASTTPTITIYDALRATADSGSMTALSTGVYEYTYTVLSDATTGLWETVVSIDLGGSSALILNDYWEVEGSPAQVIINSMSDTTVPSVSANVTISNEGNSGYEYQYEWCVVTSQDNQCGGGDDIDYASAAKYLSVGEDYTANLGLTVPNTGDYWFKVVVYYGTEASGASRTFTATEETEEVVSPGGGGGVSVSFAESTRTLYNIYNKLVDISSKIKAIGGIQGYNLDDLYAVSQTDSGDLKYIVNKTAELKAVIDVNKSLISTVANQPIIKTWWEEGSIILKIMVVNPLDASARTITVKEYLPKEIRSEHIIEVEEGLRLEYDSGLDSYFVAGEVKLGAGERKTFKIKTEDVFKISEDELTALKEQAETLMAPLTGTSYFAQAAILKSEIDANINGILRQQMGQPTNIEKRILIFRDNQKDLQEIKENIESLKQIVGEVSGKGGVFGSLFGVSTTMTWAIIIIVVIGVAVLMILLWTILMRSRALEYHVSDGKGLKAPPMVDVKKQAMKIKGGLITYLLPPFGKPMVDLKQLIKLIKILIIVGILVVLILLGFYFLKF